MNQDIALTGATVFDGERCHDQAALLMSDGIVSGIVPAGQVPAGFDRLDFDGGLLAPGFIDLQANGGGGVLFNEEPSVAGIRTICEAHARFGTTALLATLITDTPDIMRRAIDAGAEAHRQSVPGFLGLHLEGPHLSQDKRGAHHPGLIRPMTGADVEFLRAARQALPNLMVTLAPEAVELAQITELAEAGICISLGHTNASAQLAKQAFQAGARCATHLFNAMSGLNHREPGLVGAVLTTGDAFAGLIADGHHVMPDAINVALRCKTESGRIFLVTDAMSVVGTDQETLVLNGRRIIRKDGKLTLEDGTLAGADLDMATAVRFIAATRRLRSKRCCGWHRSIPRNAWALTRSGAASPRAPPPTSCISITIGACGRSGSRGKRARSSGHPPCVIPDADLPEISDFAGKSSEPGSRCLRRVRL